MSMVIGKSVIVEKNKTKNKQINRKAISIESTLYYTFQSFRL